MTHVTNYKTENGKTYRDTGAAAVEKNETPKESAGANNKNQPAGPAKKEQSLTPRVNV
jgi:hypothetical protein